MDLQKAVMDAAVEQIKKHFHEVVGAIRHPETGEFPTLIVQGNSLDALSLKIEGSPELLDLVKQKLGVEAEGVSFVPKQKKAPKVFLSYTTVDAVLARRIAEALMAAGIDTWWDQWEIKSGDSLRQRIDQGLGECTHFVVLLTPASIDKPWVNAELDAAFVRRLWNECSLIPLRHQIEASRLPPLLSGLKSPSIDEHAAEIQQVINDIHGISEKPPLGNAPAAAREVVPTGYSPAATAIARFFVEASEHGTGFDPQIGADELREKTGLTDEDLDDAIHELAGMVKETFGTVRPERDLFAEFDGYWMPWKPSDDALVVAAAMINSTDFPAQLEAISERIGWPARRLNPAASYLIRRRVVDCIDTIGSHPFTAFRITKTDDTRRFVKSRQG